MRVTKAQAQANRAHIVETAGDLFRERGYDGVGVAELMAAAGFTHGGFYKHFGSKADLMAEAAECGFSQSLAAQTEPDVEAFLGRYLSRAHRDDRSAGCTLAALSTDAARQTPEIKATFAQGIESLVTALSAANPQRSRAAIIDTLAHAIGAIVLSRACPDDSPLADEILDVCRQSILPPEA